MDQDVTGMNGGRIPRGTNVSFVVDHLKRSTNAKENTAFSVVPDIAPNSTNGTSYPVNGTVDSVVVKKNGHGLVGALIGAAAGVAATRAAGGNAGAAVAEVRWRCGWWWVGSHLGNEDGCIDKNAFMRITLRSDPTLGPDPVAAPGDGSRSNPRNL